jgi:hypothetical protein
MKTLRKILVAVWLLGAVDANAELKKFVWVNSDPDSHSHLVELEVKDDQILYPIALSGNLFNLRGDVRYSASPTAEVKVHLNLVTRPPILGPAIVEISGTDNRFPMVNTPGFIFTYDVQKKTSNTTSPSLPSNTVVIPTDASGPVEIVMESSKDLVNWTRAEPGTYGADTPKRFFRIRAVVKP